MPWKEQTTMSQREEFVSQAKEEGVNKSALCRAFGISRKTGYKWLKRERQYGTEGLKDQSRRPHRHPKQTTAEVETQVLVVRKDHKTWGGRKIRKVMQNNACGYVPAASTITAILHRHSEIDAEETKKHKPFQRFERNQPNELWQMDFKGYFALTLGGYCHPLTVLDDHSRFLVGLKACANETSATVKAQLTAIFEEFGLPESMLMDNGSAWGVDRESRHTTLTVWLLRLGISVVHGRPYHPQTQGKTERINRTLLEEVINHQYMATISECQFVFDSWWHTYNYERPHEALQLQVPSDRYSPSLRPFPTVLPPVYYELGDSVRIVDITGDICFKGRKFYIGKAFRAELVGIRPSERDGIFEVYFCKQRIAMLNFLSHNHC